MDKEVKPRKTAAEIKIALDRTKRLLILSGLYLDYWFVTKLESVLKVYTTVINPVISCSSRPQIDALIDTLYTVRANTYNALGSCSFWGRGWFGTQNIISQKFGTPQTYKVQGLPLPSKIFEWTVQDTAKDIIAQQSAAKVAIISRICKRLPLDNSEELTASQKKENKEIKLQRQAAFDALKSFDTIKTIPWLHRYFRSEYIKGRCKQNRQIVYQDQGYSCVRISRYLMKIEVQGLQRGKPVALIVRSNRIIRGQIRLIRNEIGELEIHHLETLYNRDYCQLLERQDEIGLDRGHTEVFYTSDNNELGNDFGLQLNRKTDRITQKGRNKNKLWSLAHIRYKDRPERARKILSNNLGNKTELKRRRQDDAYVNTVVNNACKRVTQQSRTLDVEELLSPIKPNPKLSRRALNRLEKWEKGTVKNRLIHWSQRNIANINWVNAAYTSQVDHRNGTLLGIRKGDSFTTYDGVILHSDHNASLNILNRSKDREITRFMNYKSVQVVLLHRTALFLSKMGLTLIDAINKGWLDIKHKQCPAFSDILKGQLLEEVRAKSG